MFVLRDVIFEEGLPADPTIPDNTADSTIPDNTHQNVDLTNQPNIALTPVEPR